MEILLLQKQINLKCLEWKRPYNFSYSVQ